MKPAAIHQNLTDANQSSWQMAFIQLAGIINLPYLSSSILLTQRYSFYSALVTVIIGNLILWIIRFGLVKISFNKRKSTLDITHDCFGRIGAYIISFALLLDALAWFFIHTSVASNLLASFFNFRSFSETNHFIQLSIIIGVTSTALCMEGMKSLRILASVAFPLLLITFVGTLMSASSSTTPYVDAISKDLGGSFSLGGISLVLSSSLGSTVDLPTFFRHRRSWQDSINALTIFQVASLLIGIGALFLAQMIHVGLESGEYEVKIFSDQQKYFLSIFLFISAIYANVYNVYSSSVGWEVVAPKSLVGRKEYMIIGLALTIFFISFYNMFSLHGLLDIADSSMMNLCIVLFCFFLTCKIAYKSRNVKEKCLYLLAWLIASAFNMLQVFHYGFISTYVLLTSISIIVFFSFMNALLEKNKKCS